MNTTDTIHQEAELWASAASTGGLTENELKAWHDHIGVCPACKQLNEEEMAMADLIKQTLDPHSPDPGFEQRILRKLNQSRLGNGNRWYEYFLFHPALALAAACVAILAVAGIGSLVHGGKPAPVASAASTSLDGLPAPVRDAIRSRTGGKTVSGIERGEEDGQVFYTVQTKTGDGRQSEFTVAGDGTLVGVDTTLAEVPQNVRDAIKTQANQGGLEGIGKTFEGGETDYVATITGRDGNERDYTFTEDGTLVEVETSLGELPGPLQAAIKVQVGKGRLEGIDKTFDNGDTNYVATIVLQDGRERDFTFNADGALSSIEVGEQELPAAVRAGIEAQVGKGQLESIDKTFDNGEVGYDATMTAPDGRRRDFSVSADGKLLSREVAMNEAPKAVQQTISRTLGEGKVVAINQSFAEPDLVPYEIEGQKDGKPLYFVVSPAGDLLNMEN